MTTSLTANVADNTAAIQLYLQLWMAFSVLGIASLLYLQSSRSSKQGNRGWSFNLTELLKGGLVSGVSAMAGYGLIVRFLTLPTPLPEVAAMVVAVFAAPLIIQRLGWLDKK